MGTMESSVRRIFPEIFCCLYFLSFYFRRPLTEKQLQYAALDAWCLLLLTRRLLDAAQEKIGPEDRIVTEVNAIDPQVCPAELKVAVSQSLLSPVPASLDATVPSSIIPPKEEHGFNSEEISESFSRLELLSVQADYSQEVQNIHITNIQNEKDQSKVVGDLLLRHKLPLEPPTTLHAKLWRKILMKWESAVILKGAIDAEDPETEGFAGELVDLRLQEDDKSTGDDKDTKLSPACSSASPASMSMNNRKTKPQKTGEGMNLDEKVGEVSYTTECGLSLLSKVEAVCHPSGNCRQSRPRNGNGQLSLANADPLSLHQVKACDGLEMVKSAIKGSDSYLVPCHEAQFLASFVHVKTVAFMAKKQGVVVVAEETFPRISLHVLATALGQARKHVQ